MHELQPGRETMQSMWRHWHNLSCKPFNLLQSDCASQTKTTIALRQDNFMNTQARSRLNVELLRLGCEINSYDLAEF